MKVKHLIEELSLYDENAEVRTITLYLETKSIKSVRQAKYPASAMIKPVLIEIET